MTEEFAIKLERLHKQIEDESDEIAEVFTGSPDAPGRPIINGIRKEFYKKGATTYGEKFLEAEQRADRYEKALKSISKEHECGCVPCVGQCRSQETLAIELEEIKSIATEALTPKQTTDDTANG